MKTTTIKLIKSVMIDGQQASPEDKNNGIYTVSNSEANNLIARKRAIKFDGKIEAPANSKNNNPPGDIEELKKIALELSVKFQPSIGYSKLTAKILEEIKKQAEALNIELEENVDAIKAYESFKKAKADKEAKDGENNPPEYTEEELKEIASAAKIELADGASYEEIKEAVEFGLEQYASEMELKLDPNDGIKEVWVKIQEKLKTDD